MKCMTGKGVMIAAAVLVTAGFAYHTDAQDTNPSADTDQSQTTDKAESKDKSGMMQCPMMAAMKDIQLFADSPPVLLGQAQNLELTEKQKQQIQAIGESARKQALGVLNAKQREQLADSPEGPLSMMALAKLQKKGASDEEKSEGMCPMCMKMMRMKMKGKSSTENDSTPQR